jgi:hypothetical protein
VNWRKLLPPDHRQGTTTRAEENYWQNWIAICAALLVIFLALAIFTVL